MMKGLAWGLVLLFALSAGLLHAQDTTLGEAEFWALLNQTDTLLNEALAQPDATDSRTKTLELWQNVQQVRLADDVIAVDVRWITEPLTSGDAVSLAALQRRIRALLADHARRTFGVIGDVSLSALDEVLQDPRFQYDLVTPTPIPTDMPALDLGPVSEAVSPGLSQILLVAAGVAAVVAVFLYFARSLQIQPASLESAAPDEPTTSASAVDHAANLAADRDYRSAIRYLYLSSLLLLDERGLLHYDSTLTNREHLRQVRERQQLHDLLRGIVNVFEDVWYGYAPVDETFYQQYLQHIHQLWQFVP